MRSISLLQFLFSPEYDHVVVEIRVVIYYCLMFWVLKCIIKYIQHKGDSFRKSINLVTFSDLWRHF